MGLALLPDANSFFTPWPEGGFAKSLKKAPYHLPGPWDPSRVAWWCLPLPPHPCYSFPLSARPFSSPTFYPHRILSSSKNVPQSLNFRLSCMLFTLPSSQDVCQSNSYLCFSFSPPPRSLLGPLSSFPFYPTWHQPRQIAGFLLLAPCKHWACGTRGVFFVLSPLCRSFWDQKLHFPSIKSQGPPWSLTISEEFPDWS